MKSLRWARVLFPRALMAWMAALCLHGTTHAGTSSADAITDVRTEVMLGKAVADRILDRHGLFEHEFLSRYIDHVGQALAAYAARPEIRFHFAILDTDDVDSYAAPGGYVFITRGALNRFQDEADLAGLLAHEIGHVPNDIS